MDPLLKTRDEIMDANWSEAARGALRVLGLMVEQGAITVADNARATTLVEKPCARRSCRRGALAAPAITSSSASGFFTRIGFPSIRAA
jgi:hypothetical protein